MYMCIYVCICIYIYMYIYVCISLSLYMYHKRIQRLRCAYTNIMEDRRACKTSSRSFVQLSFSVPAFKNSSRRESLQSGPRDSFPTSASKEPKPLAAPSPLPESLQVLFSAVLSCFRFCCLREKSAGPGHLIPAPLQHLRIIINNSQYT